MNIKKQGTDVERRYVKLDLKDKRIIFELDMDARASNAEIARRVGLSKQTVDYKIKNMMRHGVITGFYPIINNPRLGYFYGRLFIRTHNLTPEKDRQIMNEIIKDKMVNWVLRAEGGYDLWVATWAKSLSSFKKFSTDLFSRYGIYIKEMRESVGIEVKNFQPRFLLGTKETKQVMVKEETQREELNTVHKRILRLLCENARRPMVEMAEELGISPKLVAYHLKKLEEKKIILGYKPIVNYSLLGYSYYKMLFYLTNVTADDLEKFRHFIENDQRTMYTVNAIGIANLDVEVMLKSQQEYFDFLNQIKFKFPNLIKEYESMIIMEDLKVNYLPHDLV